METIFLIKDGDLYYEGLYLHWTGDITKAKIYKTTMNVKRALSFVKEGGRNKTAYIIHFLGEPYDSKRI